MKKGNKTIFRVLALLLAALFLVGALSQVFAASWNEDVYAYGSGLSQKQIEDTASFLGVKSDKTPRIVIRGEDAEKYLNEPSTDAAMISSVYIKKNNSKSVEVEVVTPLTIQSVTSLQYANAAITAGVSGLDIKVGAVVPVSGTSALSGVYKALEGAGVKLDTQMTEIANKEIELVNQIADNNKDKENFSKEKLNEAVIEGKKEIVDLKQSNGVVNAKDVDNVVQNILKDSNLNQIFNNFDIENLTLILNNFVNVTNNNNFNIDTVKVQLQDLSKSVEEFAKKEMEKVQQFLQTEEGKNYLESIKDKFSQEELDALLQKGKNALSSEKVEGLLNGIKENLSPEKLGNLIESAKDSFGIDNQTVENVKEQASGIFSKIGELFKNIFDSIARFFKNLF